jgi:hypothetical protein
MAGLSSAGAVQCRRIEKANLDKSEKIEKQI